MSSLDRQGIRKRAQAAIAVLFILVAGAFTPAAIYRAPIEELPPATVAPATVSEPVTVSETEAVSDTDAPTAVPKTIYTLPIDNVAGPVANEDNFTDTGYHDDTISIDITKKTIDDAVCWFADITIQHPSQLRTGICNGVFSTHTRENPAHISRLYNAVVAVNGDFFNYRSDGILIRNGKLYRKIASKRDLLVIDYAGDFHMVPEVDFDENDFADVGIMHTLSFGPSLIIDGVKQEMPERYPCGYAHDQEPRTAIGQLGPLHYLLLVVDGREKGYSIGMSDEQVMGLLYEAGCAQAYALDGGQSSVLLLNHKPVSKPSNGGMRTICDILYFATAIQDETGAA